MEVKEEEAKKERKREKEVKEGKGGIRVSLPPSALGPLRLHGTATKLVQAEWNFYADYRSDRLAICSHCTPEY
jgi:hypothetical protein